MSDPDKRYRKQSVIITAAVQILVLLIAFVMIAWQEPIPPIPEYGIELNFGLDETGLGEDELDNTPVEELTQDQESEEVEYEITEVPDEIAEPDNSQDVEIEQEPVEDKLSPDVVNPEITQPEPVKADTIPSTSNESKPNTSSEGENENSGDQGNPEGEIDERALYGTPGAADGTSLEMPGWRISEIELPDDKSSEIGTIIFEIVVDPDGFVVSYKTLQSTVAPSVLNLYKKTVENLILERTSGSGQGSTSRGKISFILKAN